MMRGLLSLVSPDKHALRELLTMVHQDRVTFAIQPPHGPQAPNPSVRCASISANTYWADVTLQVSVLAVVLLAQSADGACYAIMASTPDDNFHYQAVMQTLGTCQPSQVK